MNSGPCGLCQHRNTLADLGHRCIEPSRTITKDRHALSDRQVTVRALIDHQQLPGPRQGASESSRCTLSQVRSITASEACSFTWMIRTHPVVTSAWKPSWRIPGSVTLTRRRKKNCVPIARSDEAPTSIRTVSACRKSRLTGLSGAPTSRPADGATRAASRGPQASTSAIGGGRSWDCAPTGGTATYSVAPSTTPPHAAHRITVEPPLPVR